MAHPELEHLLDALLTMAQRLLEKHGELYPFGAFLTADGELEHVGARIDGDDHPPSQILIDLLTENLRSKAVLGKLRAAGLCFDGLTIPPGKQDKQDASKQDKQDAICCRLEHYTDELVNVYQPYVRTSNGQFCFEDLFATKRAPEYFINLPRA